MGGGVRVEYRYDGLVVNCDPATLHRLHALLLGELGAMPRPGWSSGTSPSGWTRRGRRSGWADCPSPGWRWGRGCRGRYSSPAWSRSWGGWRGDRPNNALHLPAANVIGDTVVGGGAGRQRHA